MKRVPDRNGEVLRGIDSVLVVAWVVIGCLLSVFVIIECLKEFFIAYFLMIVPLIPFGLAVAINDYWPEISVASASVVGVAIAIFQKGHIGFIAVVFTVISVFLMFFMPYTTWGIITNYIRLRMNRTEIEAYERQKAHVLQGLQEAREQAREIPVDETANRIAGLFSLMQDNQLNNALEKREKEAVQTRIDKVKRLNEERSLGLKIDVRSLSQLREAIDARVEAVQNDR